MFYYYVCLKKKIFKNYLHQPINNPLDLGPTGVVIQRHHHQSSVVEDDLPKKSNVIDQELDEECMFARSPPSNGRYSFSRSRLIV